MLPPSSSRPQPHRPPKQEGEVAVEAGVHQSRGQEEGMVVQRVDMEVQQAGTEVQQADMGVPTWFADGLVKTRAVVRVDESPPVLSRYRCSAPDSGVKWVGGEVMCWR